MTQDKERAAREDDALIRSEDVVQIIDNVVLDDAPTSFTSKAVRVGPFRRFALYLKHKSANAPTNLQYIVEFLNPHDGQWYQYNEGVFASLFYEDTVLATERFESFVGFVLGPDMRLRAVGTGTSSSATFTITAGVAFFN